MSWFEKCSTVIRYIMHQYIRRWSTNNRVSAAHSMLLRDGYGTRQSKPLISGITREAGHIPLSYLAVSNENFIWLLQYCCSVPPPASKTVQRISRAFFAMEKQQKCQAFWHFWYSCRCCSQLGDIIQFCVRQGCQPDRCGFEKSGDIAVRRLDCHPRHSGFEFRALRKFIFCAHARNSTGFGWGPQRLTWT